MIKYLILSLTLGSCCFSLTEAQRNKAQNISAVRKVVLDYLTAKVPYIAQERIDETFRHDFATLDKEFPRAPYASLGELQLIFNLACVKDALSPFPETITILREAKKLAGRLTGSAYQAKLHQVFREKLAELIADYTDGSIKNALKIIDEIIALGKRQRISVILNRALITHALIWAISEYNRNDIRLVDVAKKLKGYAINMTNILGKVNANGKMASNNYPQAQVFYAYITAQQFEGLGCGLYFCAGVPYVFGSCGTDAYPVHSDAQDKLEEILQILDYPTPVPITDNNQPDARR